MIVTETHRTILEMAYWMAARAMCIHCATLNDPERRGNEWVHDTGNVGENRVEYECYAGPIHRLIEKVNEVK